MNLIVFPPVAAAPVEGASILEIALNRLGAWYDAERYTLGGVLAQAGRRQAAAALERLEQLHLEPDSSEEDLRDLLEEAVSCLEFLLDTVSEIPSRCRLTTAYGLPGPAPFDRHVLWSGARLQDIVATLHRALAT
ncbi:hypothetical protein FHS00_001348 [Limimaricola variabilis]|uniref:Uncharacterized protein n=1 Tax=Limimaricola variabilis TaxID=1492771 RepID=A0ABR6HMR0_9RHOB|nr:hypothetical protein [Limimaricola variabilis]MBB3711777.1 hypothetical protein [Limimaricola variabilis]